MADWSQLPKELLDLIYKHIDTSFDLIRFRSVCSSWRSATIPAQIRFTGRFPTLPDEGISDSAVGFYLSKRTIYLIRLPESQIQAEPSSWLVKIEEDIPDQKHLINPVSRRGYDPLPEDFPRALDISRFRVCELGQEFVLRYVKNTLGALGNLYMEKVVVMCLDDEDEGNEFVFLTIHVSGRLAVIRYGEETWTVIRDIPFPNDDAMPSPFDDVILFKARFYAVDNIGRTVIVDPLSLALNVVAYPVFGGDKKFLVESCGELLLVDMYLSIETQEGSSGFVEEYFEHLACYMIERTVRFKVFKLDEEKDMWVEVNDLDDRMLFVGDDCTFSGSANDILSSSRGNCVFFADNFFDWEENREIGCRDIGVFDLESGNIGPLGKYPEYSKLFWPPPQWVTTRAHE